MAAAEGREGGLVLHMRRSICGLGVGVKALQGSEAQPFLSAPTAIVSQ